MWRFVSAFSLKCFSVRFVGGQNVTLAVASSRNWYSVKICFGLLLTEIVRFQCLSSRNSVFVATHFRCLKSDGGTSIVRIRCWVRCLTLSPKDLRCLKGDSNSNFVAWGSAALAGMRQEQQQIYDVVVVASPLGDQQQLRLLESVEDQQHVGSGFSR